jgi:hypothetical protein
MTTAPRQFNNANGAPSKFRFTADSGKQVGESNEGNNSREEAFVSLSVGEIPGGAIPGGGTIPVLKCDLAILRVEFRDISTSVVNGKTFITLKVAATVRNNGPGPSGACKIEFENDPVKPIVGPMSPVPALGPGSQTLILSSPITFESGPTRYFQAVLQDLHDIQQTNTDNDRSSFLQYPPKTTVEDPVPDLR